MSTKNYYIIDVENNVCENIVVWDGNTDTWNPPNGKLMLVQEITPTKVWRLSEGNVNYVLTDSVGDGSIGWTWDGTRLITNESQPQPLGEQPSTDLPTV